MINASLVQAANVKTLPFTVSENELMEKSLDREDPHFSIAKIEVREVTHEDSEKRLDLSDEKSLEDLNKGIGEIIMIGDQVIAFGTKIWNIITAGKPTTNATFVEPLSVLPATDRTGQAFYEMSGWSVPKVKKFTVDYKNLLGMTVISFTYGVYYQSGGAYQGKGKYLTGVNIEASDIYVAWGFNLDATSNLVSISNMGTTESPVAGATVKIKYSAKSPFQTFSASESFHVTGSGELYPVQ